MVYYFLFSIVVAAMIGGFTNYLAIKMLFRPRKPLIIGRLKVPFTPGIIPKRKDEIADALGDVVAKYLVTSQGLLGVLEDASFRQRMIDRMKNGLERWASSELTLSQEASNILTSSQMEQLEQWANQAVKSGMGAVVKKLRKKLKQSDQTLHEVLPPKLLEQKEEWTTKGSRLLLDALIHELNSPSGDMLLRQLTSSFMGQQGGGLLGALAGMFMDGDKLSSKLKSVLNEKLRSPEIEYAVRSFVHKQLNKLLDKPVNELFASWIKENEGEEDVLDQLEVWAVSKWENEALLKRLGEVKTSRLGVWLKANEASIIPSLIDILLSQLKSRVNVWIEALNLPQLVSKEVRKFPVEQLEDIVLRLSGKEFRAITWLGALLGGIIGIVQAAILLLWKI